MQISDARKKSKFEYFIGLNLEIVIHDNSRSYDVNVTTMLDLQHFRPFLPPPHEPSHRGSVAEQSLQFYVATMLFPLCSLLSTRTGHVFVPLPPLILTVVHRSESRKNEFVICKSTL